jgi:hypothetical protein
MGGKLQQGGYNQGQRYNETPAFANNMGGGQFIEVQVISCSDVT